MELLRQDHGKHRWGRLQAVIVMTAGGAVVGACVSLLTVFLAGIVEGQLEAALFAWPIALLLGVVLGGVGGLGAGGLSCVAYSRSFGRENAARSAALAGVAGVLPVVVLMSAGVRWHPAGVVVIVVAAAGLSYLGVLAYFRWVSRGAIERP